MKRQKNDAADAEAICEAVRERFEMDLVMLGVVILGLVGFIMNAVAERAERRALSWRDG